MRIAMVILVLVHTLFVYAQNSDSIKSVKLEEVIVVSDTYETKAKLLTPLSIEVVDKKSLNKHFTGNLIQALEYTPGVRSMDIGSGFSKPMIRGLAFNRIAVTENGIKQEGQQWGSDHGLEIDAFNVERVTVRKGPSSLLYGSDAMGGVVEITQVPPLDENHYYGETALLYKGVNNTYGASLMFGIKKNGWHTKFRYSEQIFGDYRVPTDTIIYLTQQIPVYGRRMKNTAGRERNVNLYTEYRKGLYYSNYSVSNVYQKVGFFPGAHGIPDAQRVQDDGDDRNIDLPYSTVNHLKMTSRQQYIKGAFIGTWDIGYQNNHREEWSKFHTHFGSQSAPNMDPDKELSFSLDTYSSSAKVRAIVSPNWEHTIGWDVQYQQNSIGGYSFLLPKYDRFVSGLFGVSTWNLAPDLSVSGGLRYDYGHVDISSYIDPYLRIYLQNMGYATDEVEAYKWRSYPVNRRFGDFSGSFGLVWKLANSHLLKANVGHSFRLPGANELAANGVHHGTFRHEQGDATLSSEKGWQLDASYLYSSDRMSLSVAPFISWFSNYIYLKPTGEWSILPHAGQIYRYTGAEAMFAGSEIAFNFNFPYGFNYSVTGEYVYTYNNDERTPLNFSPPTSMRNVITWTHRKMSLFGELHSIASQNKVAKNESATSGANLINIGGGVNVDLYGSELNISLVLRNLLDTKYYNHLSFYRKIEVPEPGRNIQLSIKVPFKKLLK